MILDIATTKHRGQAIYHNEQWSWDKIVSRLSNTHRTAESYSTYITASKPRQDEIKDVGGFVGGYLTDGYRAKGFIKYRQLLTLDIDFGYSEFWEDFTMYYQVAAVVYSTHKHSAVTPRFRLVIPLDRPVSTEEYEAIGRGVAGILGTKYFDRTTFQPERLMYWPSTSKDGEFYFKEQKGEWLSADSVLGEYRDWRNVSEWPLCPTETELIRSDLKKQEDPLEKPGIIGAFCRSYSIAEAIEAFIPEAYVECGDNRYTYTEGTTAAGAICYEDKFLYSHHSTDPINGHLCNAFDLIRIHKYGVLDSDGTQKASFQSMTNLARTDPKVIKELGIFKLEVNEEDKDEMDWLGKMEVAKNGDYLPTIDNFLLIMRNDPNLKGHLSANEFDHRLYAKGGLPWAPDEELREITDEDEAGVRHYFEKTYGMYHTAKSKDAFVLACKDHTFHPVRDYLKSLKWDGVPRLDTLFIDHLGVPDNAYSRAVTRKSLTAAVARVMQPGIKYDYMVVTIGAQGKGKSSLLYDLGKDWFSDTLDSVTGKDAYIQLQGAWLIEVAELSAIKRAELEAVKNFISKREDRFRPPFGKYNVNYKRQGVFFGSTNDWSFLKDPTGNRRFWPLVVSKKYTPGSIDADPIWAEAVYRYQQGEPLFLPEAIEEMANQQQLDHTETDDRTGMIEAYLDMMLPADWDEMSKHQRVSYVSCPDGGGTWQRDKICTAEVWCELFNNSLSDMTHYNTKFITNAILSLPGWQRGGTTTFKKYGNQRTFIRVGGKYDKKEILTEAEQI